MKLAHIADTHIRNYERQEQYREIFKDLYKQLKKEKPDYIIHCGDIAHKKTVISPEFVELCSDFFRNLESIAPTYVILGNHDGNLKNKDRQDALSPIADALGLKNLFLLKDSGEYVVDENLTLNVMSIFDEDNWVKPTNDDTINIALYHGGVLGSKTDIGWDIKVDHNVNIFDGMDFAFLGDIHKSNQVLDLEGRVRYPGSTVQQNFGETPDKGFLMWDIKDRDNFDVKHIILKDPNPHVNVVLTKTGRLPKNLKIKEGSRVRLIAENRTSISNQRRLMDAVRSRFKPQRVTFFNKGMSGAPSAAMIADGVELSNLRDEKVQDLLIEEFLKDYNVEKEVLDDVKSLNSKYNKALNLSDDVSRNVNWSIESLKWNNLFNYGEGNKVDFSTLGGIVGILGKNYSGKSSVIDSLMFTLQNGTSKNSVKNVNIINQNRKNASSELVARIGERKYRITRSMEKYAKRLKGKETQEAKMALDFVALDGDEEISLNGETRNDTDANIRRIFGTKDDFLMTGFCSQMDSLQFINQGSTDRKRNLSKFLDLEVFEKKYRLASDDSSHINSTLKHFNGKPFDQELEEERISMADAEEEISIHKKECDAMKARLEKTKEDIRKVEIEIAGYPQIDIDIKKIEKTLTNAEKKRLALLDRRKQIGVEHREHQKYLDKVEGFFSENSLDDFLKKQELLRERQGELNSLLNELEKRESESKVLKEKVGLLSSVPCGDKYPSCRFLQDAMESRTLMPKTKNSLVEINKKIEKVNSTLEEMDGSAISERIKNFKLLMEKKNTYEKALSSLIIEKERTGLEISRLEAEVSSLEERRNSYYENEKIAAVIQKLDSKKVKMQARVKKISSNLTECENKMYDLVERRGNCSQKILSLQEKIDERQKLRNQYAAYDLFKACMDSNGIGSDIIRKCLPLINEEIAKILVDIVPFEIFFELEEKRLEIYIRHPKHEPRIIEMASGAEKTIAAMAIRLALTKIGNLPTSDVFILDEPATALDADNMDGFISILEMLKSQFKTVILISHLDALKECVDSEITIEKRGGFAHVDA
ncbi:MAG: metallophosphoesterase family protein [Candidatus Bathyarchaeota archaeon]|nr:metallophosphoesterase family protein [Candidatus Bathyarchaeota archaeon]